MGDLVSRYVVDQPVPSSRTAGEFAPVMEVYGHFSGHSGRDFTAIMCEVDRLMAKGHALSMALIFGEPDAEFQRRLGEVVSRQSEYISWMAAGPMLLAVCRRRLFEELWPTLRSIFGASAGICAGIAFSDNLGDHGDLLSAARIALQRALARRMDLLVLDAEESAVAVADYRIALAMRRDIARGGGDFTAVFQPQVVIASGRPVGAEALARWCPQGLAIPPSRFIPIAEDSGLISDIGEMMFAYSARAIKLLRSAGIAIPCVAVNVSPQQSRHGDMLRTVLDILAEERLAPADIELEITESQIGDAADDFRFWLKDLVEAGFHIAIDDFGTGTSTLARISEIPASKVKLDRAFVKPLPGSEAALTVCRTTLALLHRLDKRSLAEGVECSEQSLCLWQLGCQLGQGYLWGMPMPVRDLVGWWRSRPVTH